MDLDPATRMRSCWQSSAIGLEKIEPGCDSDWRITEKLELVPVCLVNEHFHTTGLSDAVAIKAITESNDEDILV